MMLQALRNGDSSANERCGMEMVLAWVSVTSRARAGKEHRAVAMAWMWVRSWSVDCGRSGITRLSEW